MPRERALVCDRADAINVSNSRYAGTGKVVTAPGVPNAGSNDMSGIPAAVAMARAADTVVLAVGTGKRAAQV